MSLCDSRDGSCLGAAPILLAAFFLSCSPNPVPDDSGTPLSIEVIRDAVAAGDIEELHAISLEPNFQELLATVEQSGSGLLHVVQDCEIARILVAHGVDPDSPNDFGYTALHYAATEGNLSLFDCLLDLGASLSKVTASADIELNTAGMEEALSKYPEVYLAFLEGDMTVLHIAAANGKVEVLKKAIELGLSPDSRGAYDLTPLHVAAINAEVEPVRELMAAAANPALPSKSGLTAYDIAAMEIPEAWAGARPAQALEEIMQLLSNNP